MRSPLATLLAGLATLATLALATAARTEEIPTPPGTRLRGTVESDAIRELPELKGARLNRMRDESLSDVHVLDQVYETHSDYDTAVRFYDRALGHVVVIDRDQARTATGWLSRFDDGTVANIAVRNTRPTTIEVQKLVP